MGGDRYEASLATTHLAVPIRQGDLPMFGQKVRAYRMRLGWSQEDLAGRAGVDVKTVGNIETGRTQPRPSTIRLLIHALQLNDRDHADFYANATAPRPATMPSAPAPASSPQC